MKTGMQTDFVSIIQAVILVFILAESFLAKYKQKRTCQLSKQLEEEHEEKRRRLLWIIFWD